MTTPETRDYRRGKADAYRAVLQELALLAGKLREELAAIELPKRLPPERGQS